MLIVTSHSSTVICLCVVLVDSVSDVLEVRGVSRSLFDDVFCRIGRTVPLSARYHSYADPV